MVLVVLSELLVPMIGNVGDVDGDWAGYACYVDDCEVDNDDSCGDDGMTDYWQFSCGERRRSWLPHELRNGATLDHSAAAAPR